MLTNTERTAERPDPSTGGSSLDRAGTRGIDPDKRKTKVIIHQALIQARRRFPGFVERAELEGFFQELRMVFRCYLSLQEERSYSWACQTFIGWGWRAVENNNERHWSVR